jgi:hypothetical protein
MRKSIHNIYFPSTWTINYEMDKLIELDKTFTETYKEDFESGDKKFHLQMVLLDIFRHFKVNQNLGSFRSKLII